MQVAMIDILNSIYYQYLLIKSTQWLENPLYSPSSIIIGLGYAPHALPNLRYTVWLLVSPAKHTLRVTLKILRVPLIIDALVNCRRVLPPRTGLNPWVGYGHWHTLEIRLIVIIIILTLIVVLLFLYLILDAYLTGARVHCWLWSPHSILSDIDCSFFLCFLFLGLLLGLPGLHIVNYFFLSQGR